MLNLVTSVSGFFVSYCVCLDIMISDTQVIIQSLSLSSVLFTIFNNLLILPMDTSYSWDSQLSGAPQMLG